MITAKTRRTATYLRHVARHHTLRELLALTEAVIWLAAGRVAIATAPFRLCVRILGLRSGEGMAAVDARAELRAERVGALVRSASARVPWQCACLTRALACAAMLRRRGLPCTLYLGVANAADAYDVSGQAAIAAHAWLRCGRQIVTGGEEMAKFHPVGSFRSPGSDSV